MTVIILTATGSGTWTVPNDCSRAKFECIGAGAGGFTNDGVNFGGGGGGGAYAAANAVTLTPGATVFLFVGSGGAASTGGGDTWINKAANSAPASTANGALAKGGAAATTTGTVGGLGGSAAACVGDVTSSGGNGGNSTSLGAAGGGGGGGAAGPSGAGKDGGACPGTAGSNGGGGGGGSDGGSSTAGSASTSGSNASGAGGAGTSGAGGGAANGGIGSLGGGGGGGDGATNAQGANGGAGGSDTAFDATHGVGGGGGGGGGSPGAAGGGGAGGGGGSYGAGGGGGGLGGSGFFRSGGRGAQGVIVITYTSTNIGSFLPFESASRPITGVIAKDFSGFVYVPPARTPAAMGLFPPWESARSSSRIGADFPGFVFKPPIVVFSPTAFSSWEQPASRRVRTDEFQGFVAAPGALPRVFSAWLAPPRPVAQQQGAMSWVFFRAPEPILPDIDAVRRPERFRQKSKPKFRHDYSIYNHPDFDRLHPAVGEELFFEDEEPSTEQAELSPVTIAIIAPESPAAPPPAPVGPLLPLEHLALLSKSWGHAIAPPPLAPVPEQKPEPDLDAETAFAAVAQSALMNSNRGRPGEMLNSLIDGAIQQGNADREENINMLRELKSILFGNI